MFSGAYLSLVSVRMLRMGLQVTLRIARPLRSLALVFLGPSSAYMHSIYMPYALHLGSSTL